VRLNVPLRTSPTLKSRNRKISLSVLIAVARARYGKRRNSDFRDRGAAARRHGGARARRPRSRRPGEIYFSRPEFVAAERGRPAHVAAAVHGRARARYGKRRNSDFRARGTAAPRRGVTEVPELGGRGPGARAKNIFPARNSSRRSAVARRTSPRPCTVDRRTSSQPCTVYRKHVQAADVARSTARTVIFGTKKVRAK